jgi:hypothetical protein
VKLRIINPAPTSSTSERDFSDDQRTAQSLPFAAAAAASDFFERFVKRELGRLPRGY